MHNSDNLTTILVTGGSGFIGAHLVRTLVENGYYVKMLSRRPHVKLLEDIEDKIEIIPFDFTLDLDSLPKLLEGVKIVYHLAWSNLPRRGNSNYLSSDILSSVLPSLELIRLCAMSESIEKLIFTSSGGTVYGDVDEDTIIEDHSLNPISSYGLTKMIVEKYLKYYERHYDLSYVITRISNAYGPRDPEYIRQGVISTWLKSHFAGEQIVLFGDGTQVRDYVYISDVTSALMKLCQTDVKGEIFNLGSGQGHSINDIIAIMEDLGLKLDLKRETYVSFDVKKNVLNIDKLKSVLNWEPQIKLKEGVHKTLEFYSDYYKS